MSFNYYYPYYTQHRRLRSRLRKRNNNSSAYSTKYYYKYRVRNYSHFSKGINYNGNNGDEVLKSGYIVGQTWGALHKCWLAYVIEKDKGEPDKMLLYAHLIQKLERGLEIQVNDFPELGLFASDSDENDDEDDSKYVVIDPWTNEKIEEEENGDMITVDPFS
jgi:hypothetical protein